MSNGKTIMEKTIYRLQIRCSTDEQVRKVSSILNREPAEPMGNTWLEVEEKKGDEYFDFINQFLDILEGKYEQLQSVGVHREDISVWFLYQYEDQCNMEFLPSDLKRLGTNRISLCISCWAS